MEEVLEVYKRPYDLKRPQVCLDETSKQLVSETCVPVPAKPGQADWRRVTMSARRTKQDWANVLRELIDTYYPEAEKIILVMDNLNTHDFSSLYETFEPQEARRIREKSRSTTRPNIGAGSIWPRSNWRS